MAEATLQQMCRSGRDACLVAGHHRPRMTTDRRTELRDVSRLPVGDLDERDRTARDSIGDHTGAAVMREGRMPSVWRVTGTPGLSVAAPAEPGGRRIPGPEWGYQPGGKPAPPAGCRPSHGGPNAPSAACSTRSPSRRRGCRSRPWPAIRPVSGLEPLCLPGHYRRAGWRERPASRKRAASSACQVQGTR